MNKLLFLIALLSTSAFGVDQKIYAPTGKLILDSSSSLVLKPSGGSVGIGTTSPSAMLDVNGPMVVAQYIGTNPEVGGSSPFQFVIGNMRHQILSPGGAITVKLPTTARIGEAWSITNRTLNKITIQASDGFYVNEITYGTIELVALTVTPQGTGSWMMKSATGWSYPCPVSTDWQGASTSGQLTECSRTNHLLNFYFRIVITSDGSGSGYPTPIPTGLTWTGVIGSGSEGPPCARIIFSVTGVQTIGFCRGGMLIYYPNGQILDGNHLGSSSGRVGLIELMVNSIPINEWKPLP
jgi:hypothetical protein